MQNTVKEELNLHWSEVCCCCKKKTDLILLNNLQKQKQNKKQDTEGTKGSQKYVQQLYWRKKSYLL